MAVTHIGFNANARTAARDRLRTLLANLENGLQQLINETGAMGTMVGPGDGSADVDYATVASQYGIESNASARAAFNELLSVLGKLNTDASVSNVHAALLQAFNKFR